MCGVGGVFHFWGHDGVVEKELLIKMNHEMASRGPDGSGIWVSEDNKTGLCHRRLSIIDIDARSNQPMFFKHYSIVFNGEIYNYQILKKELIEKGAVFQTASDTEVILQLYAEHGLETFNKLRGMYSLVIWDDIKKEMILSRDPFGIKPLYYYLEDNFVVVASQVKAIVNSVKINFEMEPAGQVGFFLLGSVPEPFTLYKDVFSLSPGSVAKISKDGKLACHQFASISNIYIDEFAKTDNNVTDNKDDIIKLEEVVRDTIRCHLVADVPVGIYLSSGIDSSVIAALASETAKKSIVAITAGFEESKDKKNDEMPLSIKLAEKCGFNHQKVVFNFNDFKSELTNIIKKMDQPTIDGVNMYMISKRAKELGIKTVLSGVGADEIFRGYPTFKNAKKIYKYSNFTIKNKISQKIIKALLAQINLVSKNNKLTKIVDYGETISKAYFLCRALYVVDDLLKVLNEDIVNSGLERLSLFEAMDRSCMNGRDINQKISLLEMQWYMKNQLLRDADWAGMAHSIEIRVPFVDYYFVKSLNSISDVRINKKSLAQIANKYMPKEILTRKKSGFTVPLIKWCNMSNICEYDEGYEGWAKYVYRKFIDN